MLAESRVGANITEDELLVLDEAVSPLVMREAPVPHSSKTLKSFILLYLPPSFFIVMVHTIIIGSAVFLSK